MTCSHAWQIGRVQKVPRQSPISSNRKGNLHGTPAVVGREGVLSLVQRSLAQQTRQYGLHLQTMRIRRQHGRSNKLKPACAPKRDTADACCDKSTSTFFCFSWIFITYRCFFLFFNYCSFLHLRREIGHRGALLLFSKPFFG